MQEVVKKRIQLGKTLQRISIDTEELILLTENISKLILKMTILVKCIGKFCYGDGVFQNTEVGTGGVLKNFTKFTGKQLCQGLF